MNSQDNDYRWAFVSGFGPFRTITENPSWLVAKALPEALQLETEPNGELLRIVKPSEPFPVDYRFVEMFYKVFLKDTNGTRNPSLIIHLGVDAGSSSVKFEQFCYNYTSGADVNGYEPADKKVIAAEEYNFPRRTTLDLEQLRQQVCANALSTGKMPNVTVSNDPGRYLCNYIYYHALYWKFRRPANTKVLFIHVPALESGVHTVAEMSEIVQRVMRLTLTPEEVSSCLCC